MAKLVSNQTSVDSSKKATILNPVPFMTIVNGVFVNSIDELRELVKDANATYFVNVRGISGMSNNRFTTANAAYSFASTLDANHQDIFVNVQAFSKNAIDLSSIDF